MSESEKKCEACQFWHKAGFTLSMGECRRKGKLPRLMYHYETCDEWRAKT